MLLLLLGVCIVMTVVLNLYNLPNIDEPRKKDIGGGPFRQGLGGVPVEKVKKWAELRKMAKFARNRTKERSQNDGPLQTVRKSPRQGPRQAAGGDIIDRVIQSSNGPPSRTAAGKEGAAPTDDDHKLAGLNCDRFGGPSEEIAAEMVYWRDIPSDASFVSPYASYGPVKKYLTFEPDEGGWNNIRMSMETATALAHAMGRILVLPPQQGIYLLNKDKGQNNRFTFKNFFHFDTIARENLGVEVISMEEFLDREVVTGNIQDQFGNPAFPPGNRTQWEGLLRQSPDFYLWLRNVTMAPKWDFSHCVAAFASEPGPKAASQMRSLAKTIDASQNFISTYINNPTPVNATPQERLREMLGTRKNLCIYGDRFQQAKVMHFMGDNDSGARLLVHFYAYLFFEDWKHDLWTKRYVRDHLRYIDEIQCAAATIVNAVRQKAKEHGNIDGDYDSFHIRRGDFQYHQTRIEAIEIYENIKDVLVENSTVFIATDEMDRDFFKPLMEHYKVYFLSDFLGLVPNLNKNYFGMLDQRIASRGRTFVGAYFSTFTGYINRMRGYHSQKAKLPGYETGRLRSYYYVEKEHKEEMTNYHPLKPPLWSREFPVGWRDIDHDVDSAQILSR